MWLQNNLPLPIKPQKGTQSIAFIHNIALTAPLTEKEVIVMATKNMRGKAKGGGLVRSTEEKDTLIQ